MLKAVVIGLGVLILVALGVIVVTVASRLESGKATVAAMAPAPASPGTTAPTLGAGYGVKDVEIPPGARIVSVRVVGPRLLFDVAGPGPKRALMVYDLDTGKRLGTIEWAVPGQ